MGKLIEQLWDCPYCDTKKIGGSKRECPNCGQPRREDTVFYMPDKLTYVDEEKAKSINRNPDWVCPFCNSLNSDSDTICPSCGSARTSENLDYFSSKQKTESDYHAEPSFSYKDNSSERFSSSTKVANKKDSVFDIFINHWKQILIVLFITLAVGGLIYLLIPKTQEITINSFSWERSIDIEKYQTVEESDWSLPSNARLQYSQKEFYGYQDVLDHYETRSRQVAKERFSHYETVVVGYRDLGNGYAEEITEQKPVYETYYETEYYEEPIYRQESIYKTKYYYEIDKWLYDRSLQTSGEDQNPYWADIPELPKDERVSAQNETYYINGIDKKGKNKKISLSFEEWNSLEIGQDVKLNVSVFGNGKLIK